MTLVKTVTASSTCKPCRSSVDLVSRYWSLYRSNNYYQLGLSDLDYCTTTASKLCAI